MAAIDKGESGLYGAYGAILGVLRREIGGRFLEVLINKNGILQEVRRRIALYELETMGGTAFWGISEDS
jgi:hypothetical protein